MARNGNSKSTGQSSTQNVETGAVPLGQAAKDGLVEWFNRIHQEGERETKRSMELWSSKNRPAGMSRPPVNFDPLTDKEMEQFFEALEGRKKISRELKDKVDFRARRGGIMGEWLAPPDVKLIHIVRMALIFRHLHIDNGRNGYFFWYPTQSLELYRSRCNGSFGLRELGVVLNDAVGGDRTEHLAMHWLGSHAGWDHFADWEPEAIWPFFAQKPGLLKKMLGPSPNVGGSSSDHDYNWSTKRQATFKVIGMLPEVPQELIPLLWDIAMSESKTEPPLARKALAKVPDKAEKVMVSLSDGKQGVRAVAAQWLGEIGDPAAIEPLKKLLAKEKQDLVKGKILHALEALGADVNEFLDRNKLLAEAKKGLEKKHPTGMTWVDLGSLPVLHWADTGKQVDPQIIQWWVVQSIKQKSPVPGPLLRRYFQMCIPEEARACSRAILNMWIEEDTRTPSAEDAAARAQKEADRNWSYKWAQDHFGTKDKLYQQLYQRYSTEILTSANGEKGMLALAAAAGDTECARICDRYIRKHYGYRLAQCKALVEVLAWMDDPQAIQVLLAIAHRFRTKAIQKAAADHVQSLAEREGWTLDELADRTIPNAGFTQSETGPLMVLDYGSRSLTVTLNDELVPVISSEDGKVLKNPPNAGKTDDSEKVKEAKKQYSAGKNAVKEVVKLQTARLYEALCTQRAWRADEWQRYLASHPIVGRLCTRLVWSAFEPGDDKLATCFRPLEDGSFTNEADDAVSLDPKQGIRLAHSCQVPEDISSAWLQHLSDYDVEPLFEQFGREEWKLPADLEHATEIKDYEGWMLTTFQLRGKATKLGYVRGAIGDGGSFHTYHKPFPSLRIQAVISFTGSFVPEEDIQTALMSLSFTRIRGKDDESTWDGGMELKKVPAVLLSECYNDLKQIAALGSSYLETWQDASYF